MLSAKKIITILGIIIIIASLGIGSYFVYQKGLLTTSVDPAIKPNRIKVTNVSNDRFTVSWVTDSATPGSLIYGTSGKMDQIQVDDSDQLTGQSQNHKVHHITVTNLKPASTYYYKIRSGEKNRIFDDNGEAFSAKTAPALGSQPASDLMSGTVVNQENKPASDAIVYVTVPGITPLSTQVKKDGSWLISLSSARNTQLTDYAHYDPETTTFDIFVQGESLTSKGMTNMENHAPVPQIILGQAFDFTKAQLAQANTSNSENPEKSQTGQNADSELEQFPLEPNESSSSGKPLESFPLSPADVTISYPSKDGEQVTSSKPEFMGGGPANKVLTLQISASKPVKGTVVLDRNGKWSFSPSESLAAGSHTLQIDYIDNDGQEQTLKRTFTIASSRGGKSSVPSFEATPSAKTTPTPKPTPLPRTSMPSTRSGVPTSGVTDPTYMVLLLGLFLIVSGCYAKYAGGKRNDN